MIKQKVFLALLLLAMTASPVFAGKVEVRNYKGGRPYKVIYEGKLFGLSYDSFIVVNKGDRKAEDYVANTIEEIRVYLCGDEVPPNITCPVLVPDKVYKVSGKPMARRKFTVIIESSGTIQVEED